MTDAQLASGQIFAQRFMLLTQIGQGGAGAVWLAQDRMLLGKKVALKVLRPELREVPGVRERLAREAELLARLEHPHLARAIACDATCETPFLATELIEGETLDHLIRDASARSKLLPIAEVVQLFEDMGSALHYAHQNGVVHRDLKPKNVMVTRRGQRSFATVLDLGVARLLVESDLNLATTLGRRIGSIMYMSPEQTRGERATAQSDIFSLGTVLFELLTLRRTWARDPDGRPLHMRDELARGPNAIPDVFGRINRGARPRALELRPELPPEVDEVLARSLAILPSDRHASAAELVAEVSRVLEAVRGASTPRAPFVTAATLDASEEELSTVRRAGTGAAPRVPTDTAPPSGTAAVDVLHAPTLDPSELTRSETGPVLVARVPLAVPKRKLVQGVFGTAAAVALLLLGIWIGRAPAPQAEPSPTPSPALVPVESPAPSALPPRAEPMSELAIDAAPPVTPPPVNKPKSAPRPSGAVVEASPATKAEDDLTVLARSYAHAREHPEDRAAIVALGAAIDRAAADLPDTRASDTIRRLARSSADLGDLEGVGEALADLRRARRRSEPAP